MMVLVKDGEVEGGWGGGGRGGNDSCVVNSTVAGLIASGARSHLLFCKKRTPFPSLVGLHLHAVLSHTVC